MSHSDAAAYPLTFRPIFKTRPWGGRRLAERFGKPLPPDTAIGESWEISDRPGDESLIANGPLAGQSIRSILEGRSRAIVGRELSPGERFPWLIKLLDAREDLSLQVHPARASSVRLGGDTKDELWYFAELEASARIFAGLRRGVTRDEFVQRMGDGSVAQCFHVLTPHSGDAMALPSGRAHALGGGNVVFEIQENSDTTYRVFDWNRVGTDGRPRELHPEQSLASIDFADFEPTLVDRRLRPHACGWWRPLARFEKFAAAEIKTDSAREIPDERASGQMAVLGVVSGRLEVGGGGQVVSLVPGCFVLLPAALPSAQLTATMPTTVLRVVP